MDNNMQTSLLVGLPVNISNKFKFTAPLMKDIFNISFPELMGWINTTYDLNYILFKNKEINYMIEENNFSSYETWNLMLLCEKETQTNVLTDYLVNCLKVHLNEDITIGNNCEIIVGDKLFEKDDYEYFCKILKKAYGLEERIEERKFEDVKARRKAIEMRISRNEIDIIQNKKNDFIYQILSVLKTKKSDRELQNSNLFQLIDTYKRINKEKEYDGLMTGIYTGNVDTKNINLDEKHWTSSLK